MNVKRLGGTSQSSRHRSPEDTLVLILIIVMAWKSIASERVSLQHSEKSSSPHIGARLFVVSVSKEGRMVDAIKINLLPTTIIFYTI